MLLLLLLPAAPAAARTLPGRRLGCLLLLLPVFLTHFQRGRELSREFVNDCLPGRGSVGDWEARGVRLR